jgi:hypothetical protein
VLRCDNCPELSCAAMAGWAGERVGLHFTPLGEPGRRLHRVVQRAADEYLTSTFFRLYRKWSPRKDVVTRSVGIVSLR